MGKHQPALLGALFIGILSSLPYIKGANCCCLWVIVGGVLVAYLQQQNSPTPIGTTDAAIGGLIAGALGGILTAIGGFIFERGRANVEFAQIQEQMGGQEVPEGVRNVIEWMSTGSNAMIVGFFITVPIFAIFAMAGSLLGVAIFRKKVPPQPQV